MTRSVIAFIGAALLAGCTSGSGQVKLGVDVAALQSTGIDSTEPTKTEAAGLDIGRVRILVAVAKVGYAGHGDDSADAGPYAIELTADEIVHGARREFDLGTLPSGTYGGAEIEIDPLGDRSSDASFADFLSEKASVLIDGTYKGKEFSFAGHFLAEQGTDGEVTIDETVPLTLDMSVDPSAWFIDSTGIVGDPTDASQHGAIAVAICKTLDTQGQAGGVSRGGEQHCAEP